MAPALLTNDKLADKKGKQSKQNKRKMDPENHIQEESNQDDTVAKNREKTSKRNKGALAVSLTDEKNLPNSDKKVKSKRSKKNSLNGDLSDKTGGNPEKNPETISTNENKTKDLLQSNNNSADLNSSSKKVPETNSSNGSPTKSRKRKNEKPISDGEMKVKVPKASKQERVKHDLEPNVTVDLSSLKLTLASEDKFISNLLINIPSQSISIPSKQDSDGSSNEMEEIETSLPENRASNPEELQLRLAAKLDQFQGIKSFSKSLKDFIHFHLLIT